ncbi:hypothetical protein [Synechococcus sp. A15-28]|uniref:hypothetical protein n=1 Tax=Synechococcus sp. A15-28 TaxID=1050638 RepID=UPI001645B12A|nr:hypothetical protein [Synechococcus sp. A15-28]
MDKKIICLSFIENKSGEKLSELINKKSSNASLASFRLQMYPALIAAKTLNFDRSLWSMHSAHPDDFLHLGNASICLVGKMSTTDELLSHSMAMANLAAISRLKRKGTHISLLYCDHQIIKQNNIAELYSDLIYYADSIIFPSVAMQKLASAYIRKNLCQYVIRDPWQIKNLKDYRKKMGDKAYTIGWFGAPNNTAYLCNALKQIKDPALLRMKLTFRFLGRPISHELIKVTIQDKAFAKSKWKFEMITWDNNSQPQQLENFLSKIDIAVIPSDPEDPAKIGVSHNRLIDSIRSGCIPIASPMPSYKELSKICLLGKDFNQLLKAAILNYDRLCDKYSIYREKLVSPFDPATNIKNWELILRDIQKNTMVKSKNIDTCNPIFL